MGKSIISFNANRKTNNERENDHMSTNLTAVLQQILQNTTNVKVLQQLMTPDVTYVSLNFDNPELKKIEPWAGTHKGPQALADVFGAIQRFWKTLDFKVTDTIEQGSRVALLSATRKLFSDRLSASRVRPRPDKSPSRDVAFCAALTSSQFAITAFLPIHIECYAGGVSGPRCLQCPMTGMPRSFLARSTSPARQRNKPNRGRNKEMKTRSVQITPRVSRTRGELIRSHWLGSLLGFGVALILAPTSAPSFSRQSAIPQNLPSSMIPDVKCVIGLENIKPGTTGTLTSLPTG